jgi:fumarylacetoacetase
MTQLNKTHDPRRQSWLASANIVGTDFPIQNLPFGVFRTQGSAEAFRGGVAIGDSVLDLAALDASGLLQGLAAQAVHACSIGTLNNFLALGAPSWQALRHAVFDLLDSGASAETVACVQACLKPLSQIEHRLPTQVGDYTDFYTSLDHALNVGRMIRPDEPLSPNFQWLPIAYHGRASSLGVSGQKFHRPMGQSMAPDAKAPLYGPCARLDYELELAIYVGPGNAQGQQISLAHAEDHIFGISLLNDWSARDHQFWEMTPLGPFLGKNFATTVSPWIVTLEALAPYRLPWNRPADHPQPLAYLETAANRASGAIDIQLEVWLDTPKRQTEKKGPARLTHTSFKHQYWSVAQMVTQHTVGGCNLQPGDVLGSGTISGPSAGEAGAMIELTQGGRQPLTLDNGEQRAFLLDGDTVILRGWCEQAGFVRIGFGECRGEVLPALKP